MEGQDKSSPCLQSAPCTEIDNRNGDVIKSEQIAEMVDSQQLAGVLPVVAVDSAAAVGEAAALAAVVVDVCFHHNFAPVEKLGNKVKTEVNVDDEGVGKRKRGRPARGQPRAPPMKKVKEEEEEEDVCFICFDGGSLVLCDRR